MNKTTTLDHQNANVFVEQLDSGKNKIYVELLSDDLFMPVSTCETSYPLELISKILDLKGPNYLCDEILRDESPDYVQRSLKYDLLSYLGEDEFKDKRLLDFGCGSGASTAILARLFPETEIVGVELEENLLSIAKLRADYFGYENIQLLVSPNPKELPTNIGRFHFIVLSAVFEHLLPEERRLMLKKLWDMLESGGVLFLDQTPYRYYPIETHTTDGLPFLNYLPDRLALVYAQDFSKRKLKEKSWDDLLRMGIRGGSVKEVVQILTDCSQEPILLNPSRLGINDRIDLWYATAGRSRTSLSVKIALHSSRVLKALTGKTILPGLAIALRKSD
jgi:2-polyprenyl-3-methyl-5-hydroxy-6-metoxy-1,4-benzoquinol methylase